MDWPQLPIVSELPKVTALLRDHSSLVLSAPPGTGKTTLVPLHLAFHQPQITGKILVLQPRRVAARQSAKYMSELLKSPVGEKVGYHIRFEVRSSPQTKVIVMTEAILNKILSDDPALEGVGAVVIDEFHERSIHCDLAIALLKEIQESLRPDLKIVVMSATLKAEAILNFLPNSAHLSVSTRHFPVELQYEAQHLRSSSSSRDIVQKVSNSIKKFISAQQAKIQGDILIFLPGIGEIKRCLEECRELGQKFELCELHSQVSNQDQQNLFDQTTRKKPRLIFATNVAETSITLPLIDTVIDSGLVKELWVDEKTGVEELRLSRISQQSAEQRKGRAGRTHAGYCLRLWSRDEQNLLKEESTPDIRRVDMKATFLMLQCMGVSQLKSFGWFETPIEATFKRDLEYLERAEALFSSVSKSDFRKHLPQFLFLNPRVALFLAMAKALDINSHSVITAAIALENTSLSSLHPDAMPDHIFSDLYSLAEFVGSDKIYLLAKHLSKELEYLFSRLERSFKIRSVGNNEKSEDSIGISQLLAFCFFDLLCRKVSSSSRSLMFGGQEIFLSEHSLAKNSAFFIALDVFEKTLASKSVLEAKHAHGLSKDEVEKFFEAFIKIEKLEKWNVDKNKFEIHGCKTLFHFPLADTQIMNLSAEEAAELKAKNLFSSFEIFFKTRPKFFKWLTRVRILNFLAPDKFQPKVSTLSDSEIMAHFKDLYLSGLDFLISEEELLTQLQSLLLSSNENILLQNEAPHQIQAPSLSVHPIEYSFHEKVPKALLKIRLQEVFGWAQSPKLGFGKIPLLLELLSPAYKSVQITQDLQSFWAKAYFEVRKELKANYPRHAWPEDPLTANAQAKGGKKRGSEF